MKKKIEAGDVFPISSGGSVTVVKYRGCYEVVIKHNDDHGHVAIVEAGNLRAGRVKNPYHPSVLGVGYVGVGDHVVTIDGKITRAYHAWNHMMERCYSAEYQEKNPTYIGCTVHSNWRNYQVFAGWFESQRYYDGFELDKDLITEGNKVYSADTCALVPKQLNGLLNDRGNARGDLPQGVGEQGEKYQALLSVDGERHYLGTYPTPEEAFIHYKLAKEDNIKRMAEKFRFLIEHRVYVALLRYEVKP